MLGSNLLKKVFGTRNDRELKKIHPLVDKINALEAGIKKLSDEELQAKTPEFRTRIENGETLDALLPEAFAVCREAAFRTLGMRHYDVQLVGGIVLHQGRIAEMRTGEGKTLTATLPLYLNALEGKGAHLVTVNDYLAARDAAWMSEVYSFLGMTTGTIIHGLTDDQRQAAYHSDITYGTNNEFGFDYLRDNMKYELDRLVQRGLHYAIIDEVDSILIDEARTPLIISGQADESSELYRTVDRIAAYLLRDEDYIVDEEHRAVSLTDAGTDKVQRGLEIDNLYAPAHLKLLHHVNKALEAHTLYKRDERYLVRDGKAIIIDEFTGRAMEGRRWSDGLHQAIEAKENLPIQNESVTMATVTYQNFFRMYDKLSGMTGTALTEEEEFGTIYELDVVEVPTNRPIQRLDNVDVVYGTEGEKFSAIVDQIIACHEKGQPVLVGTVNVDKSEIISNVLTRKNIPHAVLNAKFHESEAEIVAQAGRKGAVTIATNMAGRGTDIVLGGNAEAMARAVNPDEDSEEYQQALEKFKPQCEQEKQEVLAAGGLYILGTERHDSRRIDNQLRGRAGRQGDPGESRFFLSLEDELMRRFGADRVQGIMQAMGLEKGVPIDSPMISKSVEGAQARVEGRNFDIRKNLLEYDEVLDMQRKATYDLRRQILEDKDMSEVVLDAFDNALSNALDAYAHPDVRTEDWDLDSLSNALSDVFNLEISAKDLPRNRDALETQLWAQVYNIITTKHQELKGVATNYNQVYKALPDFEEKTGEIVFNDMARNTYLRELDHHYRLHLQSMRNLRDQVGLHAHGQRDPKQIYKKEGYDLYLSYQANTNSAVARYLSRVVVQSEQSVRDAEALAGTRDAGPRVIEAPPEDGQGEDTVRRALAAAIKQQQEQAEKAGLPKPHVPTATVPKIGRNEPCWCGSGKKYKHCHLRLDEVGETSPPKQATDDDVQAAAAKAAKII